jgi:hypothetical protein
MRRYAAVIGIGGLASLAGCHAVGDGRLADRIRSLPGLPRNLEPPPAPVTRSEYRLDGWDWNRVARVLVLQPLNESAYSRADEEFHAALASELQRLGRFEVVAGPPDDCARLAATIHRDGTFDESLMLELARLTRADVVIHVAITQYSPYARPRMGLVVQAVAPSQAKVIASVDGLWDTTDAGVAEEIRTYYRQRPKRLPPRVRNHVIATDDAFAEELALDSPALFHRWVAHVVAETLVGDESKSGPKYGLPAATPAPGAGVPCESCGPRKSIFPLGGKGW